MKIDVKAFKIVSGSFKLLPPDKDGGKESLGVICRYEILGQAGIPLAVGDITNVTESPHGKLVLSESSLTAFLNFFRSLEDDIANVFAVKNEKIGSTFEGSSHGAEALAEILERQSARHSRVPL